MAGGAVRVCIVDLFPYAIWICMPLESPFCIFIVHSTYLILIIWKIAPASRHRHRVTSELRRGIRNIAHEENGSLTCVKFIAHLTFELSCFRENLFCCILCAVASDTSCLTHYTAIRQIRESGHTHTDRQTDTQDNYCNPRACAPRVSNSWLAGKAQ